MLTSMSTYLVGSEAKMSSLIAACTVFFLLCAGSAVTLAADPAPGQKTPVQPPSAPAPQLQPPAPPSKIDPGIHKQPETTGSPEAVVPPPVVDPNMVIDPEKPRPGQVVPPPKPDGSHKPTR